MSHLFLQNECKNQPCFIFMLFRLYSSTTDTSARSNEKEITGTTHWMITSLVINEMENTAVCSSFELRQILTSLTEEGNKTSCKDVHNHIHRLITGSWQKKNKGWLDIYQAQKSSGDHCREAALIRWWAQVYLFFRLNRGFRVKRYGEASSQFVFLTYDADKT